MQIRGRMIRAAAIFGASVWAAAAQQTPPPQPAPGGAEPAPTFRTETRLVPVDVVVMDKKGNYVRDLTKKDFKVWEDNKEQEISLFSFGSDPNAPGSSQQRYLVLFFDNSTMNMGDQVRARQEAAKFIDANAGPERLMAVVNFGGSLVISQNFTDNADRLKAAVTGARTSAVGAASGGAPRTGGGGLGGRSIGPMGNYGARTMLMALSDLSRNLTDIPGRKILILFTSGFPMNPQNSELQSELTSAIAACNHSNVAVYPIDVRGLVAGPLRMGGWETMQPPPGPYPLFPRAAGLALALNPVLRIAAFQRGGTGGGSTGGGTTGGGTTGGSTGGSRGGGGGSPGGGAPSGSTGGGSRGGTTGGTGGMPGRGTTSSGNTGGGGGGGAVNPNIRQGSPRVIIPHIPEGASANQMLMYALASGTGGFVIANTNDLLKGMESIGKEQNEYYFLAYAPPESKEGTCHEIKVKVDRGGTNLRSRSGYCNVKSKDALAGKPIETQLETRITGSQPATVPAPLQTAFFYSGPNIARVNVALAIPASAVKFEKVKGKFHGEISVLGIAYRSGNEVGARFSDTVKLDFDKKDEVEQFAESPYHYENQFEVSPGKYDLKVVFNSGGNNFGKQAIPLSIEPYDGTQFAMSALALTQDFHKMDASNTHIDAELIEGRTPLVVGALEFRPAASYRFKPTDQLAAYFEIYDPALADEDAPAAAAAATPAPDPLKPAEPPASKHAVGAQLRIVDRQSGAVKLDSGGVNISNFIRKGAPVMSVALNVPIKDLTAGGYRLEIRTQDEAQKTAVRTADFDIQ